MVTAVQLDVPVLFDSALPLKHFHVSMVFQSSFIFSLYKAVSLLLGQSVESHDFPTVSKPELPSGSTVISTVFLPQLVYCDSD